MTFSQVQRDAEMHDDAVQLAMQERRPMGYLGDSWSGGRKRGEYNVLGLGPKCMNAPKCPACHQRLYLDGTTWTCSNCPFTMPGRFA